MLSGLFTRSFTMIFVLLIPLLGTVLGSAMVFFLRGQIPARVEKLLLGFAAGVMIAASVWSLLIPAIDMSEETNLPGSAFCSALRFC